VTVISHILGDTEIFLHEYGVVAVFVILTLESLGAPLPGESLLILASVLAARGEMSFPLMLLFAWVGSVLGDNIGYLIGKVLGRTAVLRYGEKIGINAERLGRIEAVFARYGPVTVGAARFFNLLRQLNGVVAGTLGMDWWRFLLFNALGGALWVLTWGLVGYYLGEHGSKIMSFMHKFGLAAAILVAIMLVLVAAYFLRRRLFGN
jgi:membrane protein DedA with SNARE-associated domain